MCKPLSPRRRAILTALWRNKDSSHRELAQAVGYADSVTGGVMPHLYRLRQDGYVTWTPSLARTVRLTGKGLLAAQGWFLLYTFDSNGINFG